MLFETCETFTGLIYFSDEDVEVELVEEEAPFLKGYGRQSLLDLSPVKIVKVGKKYFKHRVYQKHPGCTSSSFTPTRQCRMHRPAPMHCLSTS
jgi:hypothetical protein